jgi:hypothetical protein
LRLLRKTKGLSNTFHPARRKPHASPAFKQFRQIFGMDHGLPFMHAAYFSAQAGMFASALIEEIDLSVGECGPRQAAQCVEHAFKFAFHFGTFAHYRCNDNDKALDGKPRSHFGIRQHLGTCCYAMAATTDTMVSPIPSSNRFAPPLILT